jgi:hypothetical protein
MAVVMTFDLAYIALEYCQLYLLHLGLIIVIRT